MIVQKGELSKYRELLEAKRAQLEDGLRHRDGIAVERTPDLLEEIQLAVDRDLAIQNLDREAALLRVVNAALARIADGTYGACLHCEEDIRPKRLEALPWAAYCIRCQEAVDQHDLESVKPARPSLADAA